jgi:hypothetical protein
MCHFQREGFQRPLPLEDWGEGIGRAKVHKKGPHPGPFLFHRFA